MFRGYEKRETGKQQYIKSSGPFLAKVVNVLDVKYQGALEVELLKSQQPANDPDEPTQTVVVKYLNPFYGVTNYDGVSKNHKYQNSQQSYGMWFVPPDIGVTVMVIFVEGNVNQGYWIGCVQDEKMNFMLPDGRAATTDTDLTDQVLGASGDETTEFEEYRNKKLPVGEYNKKLAENLKNLDPTEFKKPINRLFIDTLTQQGLLDDETRGLTTSSARREIPSSVFGISTPGPLDKRGAVKSSKTGFYSRLGGSSIVMDDGDEKFVRVGPASTDASEYIDIQKEDVYTTVDDTNITIPHNELVRIRTRTGHQILLHNSEDLIYIGNAKGTTWVELTANGKIDIFAEDSVSIHTKQDFNFKAGRDVNIEAGRNVNIKSLANTHIESAADMKLSIGSDGYVTTSGDMNLFSGNNYFTAAGETHIKTNIQYNSGSESYSKFDTGGTAEASAAGTAGSLSTFANPGEVADSIMKRVPQHEPWNQHENNDPSNVSSERTDRDSAAQILPVETTAIRDTFKDI